VRRRLLDEHPWYYKVINPHKKLELKVAWKKL
jgi:hypothetical protein